MDWEYFKASHYLIQIRTLIKQMKEYGVNEDNLFHEDDLLYNKNIPKVARCLKQVAIIVSINKDNGQKAWPRQILRYWHMSAAINVVLLRTKLIRLVINFLNSGSKWCSEKRTNLLKSNRMWNASASRRNRMLNNKVIIITSYAIICVSCHWGYQDNTRITVPVPSPARSPAHVWPLPLLITSDTQKSNAGPLRETRDGREEQWFITIVSVTSHKY